MKKLLAATALATALTATQAYALQDERWPRWYVGLTGGVAFLQDTDITTTSPAARGNLDFNAGGIGTLSLGYMPATDSQFLNNLRIEAELGYHINDLDSANLGGAPINAQGHIKSFSYMGNLYYDFRNTSGWTPYVGAGAGGSRINISRKSGFGTANTSDNVFAYQFMGGVSWRMDQLPMTEWSLGYRYFVQNDPQFNGTVGRIDADDLQSHSVELGAKFRF